MLGTALPAGDYTLTAVSYTADNAGGTVDETGGVTFTIADDATDGDLSIASLELVDANADAPIATIVDGSVFTAAEVPAGAGIMANVSDDAAVESVQFVLTGPNGLSVERIANGPAYSLFANDGPDLFGESLEAGVVHLERGRPLPVTMRRARAATR